MDRELTLAPLLVHHQPKPQPNSWVKILIYEPTEDEVIATRGRLYAVLSLNSKIEVDFSPLMQLIVETLQQQYFGQTEGGILQTLQAALDSIHTKLLLAGQQDKKLGIGFNFNLLTAVSWGTVLYFGQLGSSRACLLRDRQLYDIDEGEQKTTNLYLSSGNIKAGDRILLATNELFSFFDRTQLQQQLELPPDTLAQSIESQLQGERAQSASGILLLVDLKQVPSPLDEGFHILDPDKIALKVPPLSAPINSKLQELTLKLKRLKSWKIINKVPGLPVVLIGLCAIILIASLFSKPQSSAPSVNLQPQISQLQSQFTQAQQVSSINPDRAEQLLDQMNPTLTHLLSQPHPASVDQLSRERTALQNTILSVKVLEPITLTQLADGFHQTSSKLAFDGNNIYLINASTHQLLKVAGNQTQAVSTNAHLFTASCQLVSTASGLKVVLPNSITPLTAQGQAGSATSISATQPFSATTYHDNLYVLSLGSGQVVKLAPGQTPVDYFHPPLDTTHLLDIAVDGSIYVLRSTAVEQYVGGNPQPLALDRSSLLANSSAIFATEGGSNLYILTPTAVLMWTKTGSYLKQYQLPHQARFDSVAVDESHQTLYILSEGKLLKAAMSQ